MKSTRFIWGQFTEEKWFLWSIRSRGVGSNLVSSAISQINFSTSGRNKASTARENCQVRLLTLKLPFQKRENVVNYLIRLGSWSWSLICFFNQGPVESTIITILFSCNKHLALTSDYQGIWAFDIILDVTIHVHPDSVTGEKFIWDRSSQRNILVVTQYFMVAIPMSSSLFERWFRLLSFSITRVLCITLKRNSRPCGKSYIE